MRKKQVLVGVLAAIIATAAMVNYNNQPGVEVSGEIVENDGESKYVSSLVDNLDAINSNSSEFSDAYFVSARLERDKTFGEQIEIQENILYNDKADENAKKLAQEQINSISNNLTKEMSIETLLEAKGFDECIAIINEPSVNVVVKSMEELSVAQVAQIQNIVMREANATAENIHIVTKK